jgi:dipeptidyl aminopeptidase/acylaminoacyl peptidase
MSALHSPVATTLFPWLLGGIPVAAWLATNWLIRRGLAAPRVLETASPAGEGWQVVRLPTVRGKSLHAWYLPAAQPGAPALVVMHGWGSNAEAMLPLQAPLQDAGYGILFVDARCHGRSDGDDFASLPRFAEDINAALDWLAAQPGVDAAALGVIGHSVGAGAALLVASHRPGLRAVVSLAAFAHPAAMMRRWLAARRIPYWPFGAYVLTYVQQVIGARFDDIAPTTSISRIACPVLLVHGDADYTVPLAEAEEILAARGTAQVELLVVPGNHEHFGEADRHWPRLHAFLAAAFNDQPSEQPAF